MAVAVELAESFAPPHRHAVGLTSGDQRILSLAATGWSTSAIADALGMLPAAVSQSLALTIQCVGARSKMEAVLIAVRRGLIDLPTESAQTDETNQPEARVRRHQPSAVRPVQRLLSWDAAAGQDPHEPPTRINAHRRPVPQLAGTP
jgi:hypothetical protein